MKGIGMWIICTLIASIALVADFLSAPTYGLIFLLIIISDLVALAILTWLINSKGVSAKGALLPGFIAAFTLIDVGLRSIFGMRLLDFLA